MDDAAFVMLTHPLVQEHVASRGLRWLSIPPGFEEVLDELRSFGEVALVSVPAGADERDPEFRHQCTVNAAIASTTLSACGPTRLTAALRCLMEVLTDSDRLARRAQRAWARGEIDG